MSTTTIRYETADNISTDTLALIFREGQPDQFGRIGPLAIFGRTRAGYCTTWTRNVRPSLYCVREQLAAAQSCGMTHLTVSLDLCG